MKSVGEAMAIGRTFGQAFAKAMRWRELDAPPRLDGIDLDELLTSLERPRPTATTCCWRRCAAAPASRTSARARASTRGSCASCTRSRSTPGRPSRASARSRRSTPARRSSRPRTPYYYSGWERRGADEVRRGDRPSVVILGAGPNRIGQGIEFDYCCVHAAMTVREAGRDAVMVNCNPETVSTDYDTSDRLYFEPLTLEDVLGVVEVERPEGVIVQFGGQTPLQARRRARAGRRALLGTGVDAIDLAEDRGRFGALLDGSATRRRRTRPRTGSRRRSTRRAGSASRCSCARATCSAGARWRSSTRRDGPAPTTSSAPAPATARAIFLDRFLENAIEVDVDALCDGEDVWIGGIMQHVEEAGVHSGDSACVLPPHSLGDEMLERDPRADARRSRSALGVVGLINVQFARPRRRPLRHRGQPARVADGAVRLQGDRRAAGQDGLPADARRADRRPRPPGDPMAGAHVSVKEAVLPFDRFAGADAVLGPEMRSTGEVMGVAARLPDGVRQGPGRGRRARCPPRAPRSSR